MFGEVQATLTPLCRQQPKCNSPDMLVGSAPTAAAHLETFQSRTQFSMWAVMAAPLLIGSNMLHMPPFDVETYTNPEVIAIDQDPLGYQGRPIINNCGEHDKEEFERCVGTQTRKGRGRDRQTDSQTDRERGAHTRAHIHTYDTAPKPPFSLL